MSFGALPTELDNLILSYLSRSALNAMSKVSKTYRGLTEPWLYRHIKLSNSKHANVRWLVVTFLNRPELASYTRTLELMDRTVTEGDGSNMLQSHDPAQFLESVSPKLVKVISDAFGPSPNLAKNRMTWLGAILADNHVEGSLAMIAFLAISLESLTLANNIASNTVTAYQGELLSSVIWLAFNRSHGRLDTSIRPFSKLQSLTLETRSSVQINMLPGLRTLRIDASDGVSVPHLFPTHVCHGLQNLEIRDTLGCQNEIRQIFTIGRASQLRRLLLHQFYPSDGRSWQPMVDAVVDNCPLLEYLQLTVIENSRFPGEPKPLKSLTGLKNLRTLYIDIDLLVGSGDRSSLLKLNELVSSSLEALTLYGIEIWELKQLVEPLFQAPFLDHPNLKNVYGLASLWSLNELSLVSDFGELEEDELRQIRSQFLHLSTSLWERKHKELRAYQLQHGDMEPHLYIDRFGVRDLFSPDGLSPPWDTSESD